jgi:hypothetical protein
MTRVRHIVSTFLGVQMSVHPVEAGYRNQHWTPIVVRCVKISLFIISARSQITKKTGKSLLKSEHGLICGLGDRVCEGWPLLPLLKRHAVGAVSSARIALEGFSKYRQQRRAEGPKATGPQTDTGPEANIPAYRRNFAFFPVETWNASLTDAARTFCLR